jgi:lycopene beta-cyclase
MSRLYDFVIAGGGAAGLSLAYHLVHSPLKNYSILIVDKDAKDRDDRTWCFWTDRPTMFDHLVYREWGRLRVESQDFARTCDLGDYRYRMIRGLEFYRAIRTELAAFPNVEFLRGTVERVEDGHDKASVSVDGRVYSGRWVFSSLFSLPRFKPDQRRYHRLKQHFKGWEIETPERAFDPQVATLFDFRTPQKDELRFFYVLPFSERRALVEGVFLSPDNFDLALMNYLEDVLGIHTYRILKSEGGVNPLTDWPFPRRLGARVLAIGALGGRIKPSSGYAFLRIHQDSQAIINSICRSGHPFDLPESPWIYRLCDTLMLQIMHRHGTAITPTFIRLFKRNPVGRIFRFLDEASTPSEILWLMATLAQPVMLPAFFRTKVLGKV